jgi:hypothetical protein
MIASVKASAEVTLDFEKAYEAVDLLNELKQWTPMGGWSEQALDLLKALAQAGGVRLEL